MRKKEDLILKLPLYFAIYGLFIFLGITLLAYFGKDNLHIYFNKFHTQNFDLFFKYYTNISINFVLIFLIMYIFLKRTWYEMTLLLVSYGLSSLINTIIKRGFFKDVHRPTYYFEMKNVKLHLVEGVQNQIPYTFPSGHCINAFIFFAVLCVVFKNKWLQIPLAILAILVAISRVYLSKHFVLDAIGGSFLGMFIFILVYYFLQIYKV